MKLLKTAFTTVLLGLLAAAPAYSQTEQDAEAGLNAALGIIGSNLQSSDLNGIQVEAALSAYLATLPPAQREQGAAVSLRVIARLAPDFFDSGLRAIQAIGVTLDRDFVATVVEGLPAETKTVVEDAVRTVAPDAVEDPPPPAPTVNGQEDDDQEDVTPEIEDDGTTPPVENDADLTEDISPT